MDSIWDVVGRYHKTDIEKCGLCGGKSLNDLGHGKRQATIICNSCNAKYWGRWYTADEWEEWINAEVCRTEIQKNFLKTQVQDFAGGRKA